MIIINRGAQLSVDTRKKERRETSNRGIPFPRNNAHAERKKSARRYTYRFESKFLTTIHADDASSAER